MDKKLIMNQNEIEEIVKLIHKGIDLELLSFELDIPIEQLQSYAHKPKKKASNLRRKEKQDTPKQEPVKEDTKKPEEVVEADYGEVIKKYKEEISGDPQNSANKRNLLAFAYFKAGKIEEARDELLSLIDERGSYMAYRQLIHLEKSVGNFEDAKLWAYDFLDRFPRNINVREQLIEIAVAEGNRQEQMRLLKEILDICPGDKKYSKMLEAANNRGER